jgi:hypothetical protein
MNTKLLTLSQAELDAVTVALSGFLDNEHDKGTDEGAMVDCASEMIASLTTGPQPLTLLQAATLNYACESQGGTEGVLPNDPPDEEDAQAALMRDVAARILTIMGVA